MLTKLRIKLRQLYFKDTQFANLMTKRIFNVLLVATLTMRSCWKMTAALTKRFSMNI